MDYEQVAASLYDGGWRAEDREAQKMSMKEKAIKEWKNQNTQVLYYLGIYGYLKNKNLQYEDYYNLYMIHQQARAAIERILSETTIKKELPKIRIDCVFDSQIQFLKWKENFEKSYSA